MVWYSTILVFLGYWIVHPPLNFIVGYTLFRMSVLHRMYRQWTTIRFWSSLKDPDTEAYPTKWSIYPLIVLEAEETILYILQHCPSHQLCWRLSFHSVSWEKTVSYKVLSILRILPSLKPLHAATSNNIKYNVQFNIYIYNVLLTKFCLGLNEPFWKIPLSILDSENRDFLSEICKKKIL